MDSKKINKSLGIPEGYFSDLEKSIMQSVESLEMEKELKNRFGDEPGFGIPNEYFTGLEKELITSVKPKKTFKLTRVFAAAAASLILGFFVFQNSGPEQISDLSFDELLAETEINEEFLEYFSYEDLTEISVNTTQLNEIENEAIEFLLEDESLLEEFTDDYLEL